MNKKEFLTELENRLAILDEKEIKDIINEYRDIIEEKVKAGKTEIEAVEEFGSIDELCREILIAYKVNPKFAENNQGTKNAAKTFESWIKSAASELSKFAKDVGSNLNYKGKPFGLELAFEIFIKIFILLILLAVLRLPFFIIGGIGSGIFNLSSSPIDFVFNILWWLLSAIIYLGLACFIFWMLFKEYFNAFDFKEVKKDFENKTNAKSKKKVAPEKEQINKEIEEKINDKINEEIKREMVVKERTPVTSSVLILIRILVVICFLVPLWIWQAVLIFALILTIYYVITGINIIGLTILILGIIIGVGALSDFIYNLTFNIKKIKPSNIIPMIISIPIMMIGGVIFASNIFSFNYIDESPNHINNKTSEKTFYVNENKRLYLNGDYIINYETDDNLASGEIKMIIAYPDYINNIIDIKLYERDTSYFINWETRNKFPFKEIKTIYNLFINDLKEGNIYNYHKLYKPEVTIVGSTDTLNRIK